MKKDSRSKRHPNLDQRRSLRAAEIALFIGQYARKAPKGSEPNDRRFSKDVERRVKHMNPMALDALMREDED